MPRLTHLALLLALLGIADAQKPQPVEVERASVGDAPDTPGPLATNLSPKLKSADIKAATTKVADWQLKVGAANFNRQWTFAALYDGLIAASKTTGDPVYRDAVVHYSEQQQWKLLNDRFPHADDMAMGKAYMELYLEDKQPVRMADTKAILDQLVVRPDDPAKELWWWCDALYMAPPVLARMSKVTGDPKYDAYMDHEWDVTTKLLYDTHEHLYFRDARYLTQKQANGKPLFWSRGNGWVMGALVKVLQVLPANDPSRPRYIQQLKEMAAAVAAIQSPDGLWRTGLLMGRHAYTRLCRRSPGLHPADRRPTRQVQAFRQLRLRRRRLPARRLRTRPPLSLQPLVSVLRPPTPKPRVPHVRDGLIVANVGK